VIHFDEAMMVGGLSPRDFLAAMALLSHKIVPAGASHGQST